MSNLIVRLLLSILMIPLAGLLYTVVAVTFRHSWNEEFVGAGLATWAFVAIYWIAVWKSVVPWTKARVIAVVRVAMLSALVGVLCGVGFEAIVGDKFGNFVGSVAAPALWLVGTLFVWKRVRRSGSSDSVRAAQRCWFARPAVTT